jgi:type IV pilus assembly protein PilY1
MNNRYYSLSISMLLIFLAAPGGSAYAASAGDSTNLDIDNPSISWDVDIEDETHTNYVSPLSAGGKCTKVFTVNVMFQVSQQESNSDSAIEDTIANGGFGVSAGDFPTVIEYLNDADLANGGENGLTPYGTAADLDGVQNVTSYFITDKTNTKTRGYAQAGGTDEPLQLSEDPETLVEDLENLFDEMTKSRFVIHNQNSAVLSHSLHFLDQKCR